MTRQLLDNVIGNALKYTLPGQPAHIDISAEPGANGWTRVLVADRGIGIPTADQPHVFTSFHRAAAHTAYIGTGLGLAICHRVIHRHGGAITASDNPGGGTRITFTLPTTPTLDPPAPIAPPLRRTDSSPCSDRPAGRLGRRSLPGRGLQCFATVHPATYEG